MKNQNINLEIKKIIIAELQGPELSASKVINNILCHFIGCLFTQLTISISV